MKSLITGISGFIGQYLKNELILRGDEVFGISRSHSAAGDIPIRAVDLADPRCVHDAILDIKPDRVFHLSALNNVMDSFLDPTQRFRTNVNGTINLMDAIRGLPPGSCRFVSIGSAAEYGATADLGLPLQENQPLAPRSPYGASKAAQSMMSAIYAKAYGLHTVHIRPFAIIGPGKERDVISDFCRGVVKLKKTNGSELLVGHLQAERDFVDVRDFIQAMLLVDEHGAPGEVYNICSGVAHSLNEIIEVLAQVSGVNFSTKLDPSRQRPTDDLRIIGSNLKIANLGFRSSHSFLGTIEDTYRYWSRQPY